MKKILSVVMVICILMSSFGMMPVFGATASAGVSVGGGGGGLSADGETVNPSLSNGYADEIYMDLVCGGNVDIYQQFYSGDLEFTGEVIISSSEKAEIFAVIALYDISGALTDFAFRAKTISASDGKFCVELSGVNTGGTIKCMLIDGVTLSPLCPAKAFNACSDSLKVDLRNVDYSQDTYLDRTGNFTIDCYLSDEATRATSVDVSSDVKLYINGEQVNKDVELADYSQDVGTVEFIKISNDKYVDRIDITIYEYGIVEEVISDKERISFVDGNRILFNSEDPEQEVNILDNQGNNITIADIQPGDTLAMVVGEISNSRPVVAKSFEFKITVYNLGDTSVEGTISGMQQDVMRIYINDVWYRSAYDYVMDDFYCWSEFLSESPIGRQGMFYTGLFDEIIGIKLYRDCTYGFILQTHLNEHGFESQYQVKMLTENEGIVVYNVSTKCKINGETFDVNSQGSSLGFGQYDPTADVNYYNHETDARYRLVQYRTNLDGEIKSIDFLEDMYSFRLRYGEYYKPESTLWDVELTDDTIIFNVSCDDINDMSIITKDNLYDEAEYEGYKLQDSYSDDYNIIIIKYGSIFKEESDVEETVENNFGFVFASEQNPASFEDCYYMSVLTENEGVVKYNIAPRCTINGYRYTSDEQGAFLTIPMYDKSRNDESDRVINFGLDSSGRINSITFVNTVDTFDSFNDECYGDRVGDTEFSYKSVIFDLSNDNLDEVKTIASRDLFTGSVYSGVASCIDINGHYNVAVLTERIAYLCPGEHWLLIDSAQLISYGEDEIDAIEIKYFTDDKNDTQTAIFTEESVNMLDDTYDYKKLDKGTIFEANIKDGLVVEYAIVAEVVDGSYALSGDLRTLTETIYREGEVDKKEYGIELIYGYISDINGNTLTLGGTAANDFCDGREFVVDSDTAQYCYNTSSLRARLDVGTYLSTGVDAFDEFFNEANLVFMKVYNDRVTDIISFSQRVSTDSPGIIAQTHYTGPGLDLN